MNAMMMVSTLNMIVCTGVSRFLERCRQLRPKGDFRLFRRNQYHPFTIVDLNNDFLEFSADNPIDCSDDRRRNTDEVNTLDNISSNTTLFEVGSDPLRLDLNTSWMRTKMAWGNRYEGGWSYGGRGINISYFQIGKAGTNFRDIE